MNWYKKAWIDKKINAINWKNDEKLEIPKMVDHLGKLTIKKSFIWDKKSNEFWKK